MTRFRILVLLVCISAGSAAAQSPKHEFRGAWIATVLNLDWPQSPASSTGVKQAQLAQMLDDMAASGVNSVMFQVRAECDAFYDSPVEPWSVYLTGEQGRAPSPFFDPLEFAVQEAHARGLSLHAWLNPFRCEREVGRHALAANHPVVLHPEWMITLESQTTPGQFHTIMNPGLDAVHEYVAGLIDDILRRYDVDGIHFDDYFYPYPPYQIGNKDLDTFNANPRGFGNIADWRRDNVNRFVARVHQAVQDARPEAVFGISPFGIWRTGVPPGTSGLSGADALYADARAWLDEGTVDYLAPQLYWPFGGSQDFAALSRWWASVSGGRHLYPGLAAYRADRSTYTGTLFSPTEIPNQIRFGRGEDGVQGHILFRARNLTTFNSGGLRDSLRADLYSRIAIPPAMPWRDLFPPDAPYNLSAAIPTGAGSIGLQWDTGFGFVMPRSFAVYRTQGSTPPDLRTMTAGSEYLIARTYDQYLVDRPQGDGPFHYVVTALSANFAESDESEVLTVSGSVSVQPSPTAVHMVVYPNPFTAMVWVDVPVGSVSLEVFDTLGRRVGAMRERTGTDEFRWMVPPGLGPGLYVFRVTDARGYHVSRTAMLAR